MLYNKSINFVLLVLCIIIELNYSDANNFYQARGKRCKYTRRGRVFYEPCKSGPIKERPRPRHQNYKEDSFDNLSPCTTSDGFEGLCRSPAYCFSQYDNIEQYSSNRCPQSNGVKGVCCPNVIREPAVKYIPIKIPIPVKRVVKLDIDRNYINEAAEESKKSVKNQLAIEKELIRSGFFQKSNTMEKYHQAFFGPADPEIQRLSQDGLFALETTLQIAKRYRLSRYEARDGLTRYSLLKTSISSHCLNIPKCNPRAKYRTIDGSCNNLEQPLWAKSLTQLTRLLPPDYADGLNELRVSKDGKELPPPRVVSLKLAADQDIPDKKFTLMVMQWGQFIDHDLTLSASTRAHSGEGLHCCHEESVRRTVIRHPACKPIIISRDDPFYKRHNHFCNNFVRNAPGPTYDCSLGPREQFNTLTHVIDGSMVYGSTDERAHFLRSFRNGKLRIEKINNLEFLPFDLQNRSDECAIPRALRQQQHCFVGGDVRVNEQTGLTMLHNLMLREHNRIATVLQDLNPEWNDEAVYQESRRIVAAQIQMITYNEWMPLILGRRVMKDFNLLTKPEGYTHDYDPYLNPGVLNEFATAAYRFHTLIQGILKLLNNNLEVTQTIQLRKHFNNPSAMYRPGAYDEFLNGYSFRPSQTFDQFFTQDITNHLFQEEDKEFGMDLIALNIQRGRDHGLPGYNKFREVCGLPRVQSFEQLGEIMREGMAEAMAQIYRHVDDIDLFIAGNHEKPLPDAVVGPTFACILAEQARRNKVGDRYWFENGKMPHSFSPAQLNEIRKANIAALICDNSYNIQQTQPLALLQKTEWNPRIDCSQITRVNLNHWKNEKVWGI